MKRERDSCPFLHHQIGISNSQRESMPKKSSLAAAAAAAVEDQGSTKRNRAIRTTKAPPLNPDVQADSSTSPASSAAKLTASNLARVASKNRASRSVSSSSKDSTPVQGPGKSIAALKLLGAPGFCAPLSQGSERASNSKGSEFVPLGAESEHSDSRGSDSSTVGRSESVPSSKGKEPVRRAKAASSTASPSTQSSKKAAPSVRLALSAPPLASDSDMATRNKPRPAYTSKDDHGDSQEEQALWNQIQTDMRKCSVIQKKQITATERIKELYDLINKTPGTASSKLYEEMDGLTREVSKLTQEEQRLLNEEPTDIIRNIEILKALRAASSNDPGRASSPNPRNKEKQRKKIGSVSSKLESADTLDSPGPSPLATNRLKSSGRSGSVAAGRETKESSVKIEDDASSSTGRPVSSTEGSKGPSAERAGKFFVGAEVAYKQAKPKEDGSQWIQCTILSITERNGKKRYEVQDPEPDETGAPGDIYTASASALIAIPPLDAELGEIPVGKAVLARYPETTTFYRAEVTGHVSTKNLCRLKFEDDQNQEMEVDRRFVLSLDK